MNYNEFFEMFDIPPMTRKGQTYFTSVGRFAECVAEEDMYPTLNNDFIVEMENELLTYKPISEISLDCSNGDFEYCFQLVDPSDPDDWENSEFGEGNTRLDSLIDLLMQNPERYKTSVRKVISKLTNWDLQEKTQITPSTTTGLPSIVNVTIPPSFNYISFENPCGSLGYKHLEE